MGRLGVKLSVPPRRSLGFCEDVSAFADGIEEGVEVFGFTAGEFSLIDLLRACVLRMDRPALVVSTWTAAKAEMEHVFDFLSEGRLKAARWIVDRSFQNRQPALCNELRRLFGDESIRVQRVHSKFALIEDEARQVSIQTSANLNKNMRIENVCVSSCPVFFASYADLVAEIFGTQLPGDGFDSSAAVTQSFRRVTKKETKRKTVQTPWHT